MKNNTCMQEVFMVSKYGVYEGKLILHGRVLNPLKIEDRLFLVNHNGIIEQSEVIIKKINAYQHAFYEIREGMTCELIAYGTNFHLKENCVFYMKKQDK